METRVIKSAYGSWMAETMTPLTEKLHITITTMKRHGGNITTTAQVGKKESFFFIHEPFKDFRKTLICYENARCTKTAVENQHAEAMAMLDSIKPEALAHYN